ncbi:MAG TPA: ATP-binding protein [Kiritimatiellia bacterium]|nr:ATP-binding protein [Kiritimatiellia bacterium]HMP00843.1 ATP-binding protein [Kiritimatiellia bacterium]
MYTDIWRELASAKSMVFMTGPRQCGKTTLAKHIGKTFAESLYLNWDYVADRTRLLKHPDFLANHPRTSPAAPLVILDEIHKYRKWKAYLKGLYDTFHEPYRFLITGSGRLDIYQRGGDSLAGRYESFHLWPFTVSELAETRLPAAEFFANPTGERTVTRSDYTETWKSLLEYSGFPEPFLAASTQRWRRWSQTYSRQIIREDIRDLTDLKHLDLVEALYSLLPERVGSLLSLNSLAELLQVSYNTAKAWVEVLERYYMVFRIGPWSKRISRGLRKEQKLYLFDLPRIDDPAARFENAVAMELHRAVSSWNDLGLGVFQLHFIRNKEKQEVDFLITQSGKPWLLVEAKQSETSPSNSLRKFQATLNIPAVQVVDAETTPRWYPGQSQSILVTPAWRWLPSLP